MAEARDWIRSSATCSTGHVPRKEGRGERLGRVTQLAVMARRRQRDRQSSGNARGGLEKRLRGSIDESSLPRTKQRPRRQEAMKGAAWARPSEPGEHFLSASAAGRSSVAANDGAVGPRRSPGPSLHSRSTKASSTSRAARAGSAPQVHERSVAPPRAQWRDRARRWTAALGVGGHSDRRALQEGMPGPRMVTPMAPLRSRAPPATTRGRGTIATVRAWGRRDRAGATILVLSQGRPAPPRISIRLVGEVARDGADLR